MLFRSPKPQTPGTQKPKIVKKLTAKTLFIHIHYYYLAPALTLSTWFSRLSVRISSSISAYFIRCSLTRSRRSISMLAFMSNLSFSFSRCRFMFWPVCQVEVYARGRRLWPSKMNCHAEILIVFPK